MLMEIYMSRKIRNKILSGSVNSRGKWNVLKVFNGADKDRDGLLSALEWERLVVFKRGVVVSPDVAKRLFHELDPQESGAVDFDQFSNFLHNGVSNPRTAASLSPAGGAEVARKDAPIASR